MADTSEDVNDVVEEVVEAKGEKGRESKQLSSVTDYHEEKESIDTGKAQAALTKLNDTSAAQAESAKKLQREQELAKIKVSPEDINILKTELELTEEEAERRLKEFNNDVQAAIRDYIKTIQPTDNTQSKSK